MADTLQESLKKQNKEKLAWIQKMKAAGYTVRDGKAFKRTIDPTSASGYRDKFIERFISTESKGKSKVPVVKPLSKIEQRAEELRIRNKDNEALLAKNRAALTTQGVSRNWDNPVGDELWLQDTMEPETGGWNEREGGQPTNTAIRNLQATNKYKAEKFEKERQAGWAEADLQDAKDLGTGSAPGEYKWTTDQKVEDKGLRIGPVENPVTPTGKNKTTSKSTGTSLEKKYEKIFGKRKMKRFNQVYGKLNLSDRMRRHLLMSKAFRDM